MNVKAWSDLERGTIVTGPDGFRAFERIRIQATGSDLACNVELTAVLERGVYAVTDLRCTRRRGGREIAGEVIRSIPVVTILRSGALRANKVLGPGTNADFRRQGPTDESLQALALVYRMATAVRDDPTRAVQTALGLTRPTAGRWVHTARQRGFLGPTEPGKAGER